MTKPLRDLDLIERWMQTVLMHPAGVAEGVASANARKHIDTDAAGVEAVVTRSRSLSGLERLAIYGRAYHARLIDCLHDEFPVLLETVGEEIFDHFAFAYLQKYPSHSYTLGVLGAKFPRYLAEIRPEAPGGEDAGVSWPDFLIDLATLEWTINEVFDGPGLETEPPLDAVQLQNISYDEWPDVLLVPAPCLRLMALRFPISAYYTAVRKKKKAVIPKPADSFLAITRRNYMARRYVQHQLLNALLSGKTVGEAIATVATTCSFDLDHLAEELRTWFAQWAGQAFFRSIERRS